MAAAMKASGPRGARPAPAPPSRPASTRPPPQRFRDVTRSDAAAADASNMSARLEAATTQPEELDLEAGRVNRVRNHISVLGDEGMAWRLQQQEFDQHFHKNREERGIHRDNIREAKLVQTEEEERQQIARLRQLERMAAVARADEAVARRLQEEDSATSPPAADLESDAHLALLLAGDETARKRALSDSDLTEAGSLPLKLSESEEYITADGRVEYVPSKPEPDYPAPSLRLADLTDAEFAELLQLRERELHERARRDRRTRRIRKEHQEVEEISRVSGESDEELAIRLQLEERTRAMASNIRQGARQNDYVASSYAAQQAHARRPTSNTATHLSSVSAAAEPRQPRQRSSPRQTAVVTQAAGPTPVAEPLSAETPPSGARRASQPLSVRLPPSHAVPPPPIHSGATHPLVVDDSDSLYHDTADPLDDNAINSRRADDHFTPVVQRTGSFSRAMGINIPGGYLTARPLGPDDDPDNPYEPVKSMIPGQLELPKVLDSKKTGRTKAKPARAKSTTALDMRPTSHQKVEPQKRGKSVQKDGGKPGQKDGGKPGQKEGGKLGQKEGGKPGQKDECCIQ